MRFVFDIDGTLCGKKFTRIDYNLVYPFIDIINFVNKLYDEGHYIILHTARGMGTNDGVVAKAYNQWYTTTELQLNNWGVKYHELHMGKPLGDVYIDDRALRVNEDGAGSLEILKKFILKREDPSL